MTTQYKQYIYKNGEWRLLGGTGTPSDIVNTITTTAGAHTAITSRTGAVSFSIPTTAAHVGAAASSHTHGNITNAGDITATATIASGDRIIINDESASKVTNSSITFGTSTTKYLSNAGTWVDVPTVNNATLTIQKNGSTVNTFTANASSNVTANITVPTKVSELTNDSGFITNAGVTGVKGNSESSYRTGQVNLTAANIGAIPSNSNGNTQNLLRPLQLNGLADVTLDAKINTLRANRLAFLPADQIIIEKTTDGGSTWTDAGVADSTKVGLFSETRAGVSIPLLNGVKNINCGLRITITGMKYNVPSGTAETSKYNYWNSNYIVSTERYNQLKEMYFWVSANSDTISVKVERATGAASTTWNTIFDNSSYGMTGWSGNDYIRFAQGVFGGGTNQTSNYWNYRLTFFTRGPGGSTTLSGTNTTSAQVIQEIRGYGDTWWTAGNEYAANDKIYTHDYLKNVTFPAKVTASGGFSGNVTGNVSGTAANVTGTVAIANGGTGQTTAASAINALLNGLPIWTADPTDTTYFVRQDTAGSASYGKVAFSTIWNYISGKLPAWAKASTKPTYTASEVGALASNTTYVSTITTSAGSHSTISSKSGAISFNVPTKTSHLTNDSGFITASHTSTYSLPLAASGTRGGVQIGYSESGTNYAVKLSSEKMYVSVPWTDTKVTTEALTSGTTYYPILATGTGTATRQIDSTLSGLKYVSTAGTTSAVGTAILYLGNTTGSGTANNEQGVLRLYSSNATYYTDLKSSSASSNKTITFPNATGTVALTSDIPTVSYPVTSVNNKTGAVSLTASDVGALASSTTYVSTITTTAGTHTAISSKTGAVSFNVPTKTSHLTNDSGFLTSSSTLDATKLSGTIPSSCYTNTTYGIATNTTNGLVKPWYTHTAASTGPTTGNNATAVTVNTITTTASRYYAVEADNAGRLFVNVPWTDTNTEVSTLTLVSGSTAGTSLAYGGKYTLTAGSKTVSFTMPASDNTDEKVKLTSNTGSTAVPLVLGPTSISSGTAYNCLYNTNLKYTPSTGNLQTTQLNGVTIGSSPKFTDTVTTVTASGTGNVVTGMTASNGAITYTMGTVTTTAAQIVRW